MGDKLIYTYGEPTIKIPARCNASWEYYSVASIRVMPPHLPVGDLLKAEHEEYLAKAKSKCLIFNQEIS